MKKLTFFTVFIAIIIPLTTVFAEGEISNAEKISETTQKISNSVRDTAMPWYKKIDTWRMSQNETWKALKIEKELQITQGEQELDQNRDNRVDKVLNEEQVSLVNNSGQDIQKTGNVFLLKLYVALLSLFVIVFSYPVVFYVIIAIIIFSIISSLFNKIRHPHAF